GSERSRLLFGEQLRRRECKSREQRRGDHVILVQHDLRLKAAGPARDVDLHGFGFEVENPVLGYTVFVVKLTLHRAVASFVIRAWCENLGHDLRCAGQPFAAYRLHTFIGEVNKIGYDSIELVEDHPHAEVDLSDWVR